MTTETKKESCLRALHRIVRYELGMDKCSADTVIYALFNCASKEQLRDILTFILWSRETNTSQAAIRITVGHDAAYLIDRQQDPTASMRCEGYAKCSPSLTEDYTDE